jgi:hypothetical protein
MHFWGGEGRSGQREGERKTESKHKRKPTAKNTLDVPFEQFHHPPKHHRSDERRFTDETVLEGPTLVLGHKTSMLLGIL